MNKSVALIFAGGVGTRMNNKALPKQFLHLHGKPILIHTLEAFEKSNDIDEIVVVMVEDWMDYTNTLINEFNLKKVKSVVRGGINGQQSIYNGLVKINELYNNDDIVLIHDGVRPLIDDSLISLNIEHTKEKGNAISSVKARETIVMSEDGIMGEVVDRSRAWIARAPQTFFLKDILFAHKKAIEENKLDFVDSCTLMQYYGNTLHLIECSNENIKITTPEDFYIFRALIDKKENEQLL